MDETALPVPTADGALLMACAVGPHDGRPVLLCHGTPGSRLFKLPDHRLLEHAGVRLLTYDRPGYGESTPRAGRAVADAATDLARVADALSVQRFAVLGFSGGGPHALAAAAVLGERVTRCAVVSGVAPMDAVGLDWFAGMSEGNVQEFDAALSGRDRLSELVSPVASAREDDVHAALASFKVELPEPDQRALEHPAIEELMTTSMSEGLRNGPDGWIDDDLAFCRGWGFDVTRVRVPTGIWHGTEDALVPASHAAWLAAAIPGAQGHVMVGAGHFGPLFEMESILRWLVD